MNHLPITVDQTSVISLQNNDAPDLQLPVSSLSDEVKLEIQILDNIRQNLSDEYHAYNKTQLAVLAQQNRIQLLLRTQFAEKESEEKTEDK